MTELIALTGRHLRSGLRSRAVRAAVVALVLGLALAGTTGEGMASAGFYLVAALFVVLLVVTGFAVGAGGALPDDRVSGREAWLATLAPAGWKRRLAVILAGWTLAVGFGVLGGAGAGLVGALTRDDLAPRAWSPVVLPQGGMIGGAEPLALDLPAGHPEHRELEIEVRPLLRGLALIDTAEVLWTTETGSGTLTVPVRGPIRLVPPAGSTRLQLASLTSGVRLRPIAARRLGPTRAPIPTLAWVGLLLGLGVAAVTPVAVWVSRVTTGQTAAAAAFSLLLLGSVKQGLREAATRLDPEGLQAIVPAALETFATLAPDVPLLAVLVDATAQRAPAPGAIGAALPALAYAALVAVPACLPAPARWRAGVNT